MRSPGITRSSLRAARAAPFGAASFGDAASSPRAQWAVVVGVSGLRGGEEVPGRKQGFLRKSTYQNDNMKESEKSSTERQNDRIINHK